MLSKFVGLHNCQTRRVTIMGVVYCNDTSKSFSSPTMVENAAYGRVNENYHHNAQLGPLTPPTNDQPCHIYETVQ